MFRPYRTLKIKVPRPCCPWCQTHSERIEQKLQAIEEKLQELSARLADTLTTTREAENVSGGILTALQVFGLTSNLHPTGEAPQSDSVQLVGAFSAIAAALDRLADASAGPAPPNPVPTSPKTLPPNQLTQIAAPQNGSEPPPD
jgi:hypothetical protein